MSDFVDDRQRVRDVMERLAYEAHRAGRNKKTADLSREDALKILEEAFAQTAEDGPPDYGLPAAFLDYVDQRSGLLIGRGGDEDSKHPSNYSFPHRTFQEYLAGCYAVTHSNRRKLLPKLAGEDDYWSVAVQMGAEDLIYNRRMSNTLLEFSMQLCPGKCTQHQDARCALWAGKMVAEIGVSVVKDDKGGSESGVAFLKRLRKKLVLCLKSKLPPIERAETGIVLSQLGDPRKAVMLAQEMEFCHVPAGPFWMGCGEDDEMGFDREKPLHRVTLTYDYWIGRYPVTVAQFRQYMEDTGVKAGDDDTLIGPENHPVQSVNWHETQAYCDWLTRLLQNEASHWLMKKKLSAEARNKWEAIKDGSLMVGLPSEAEWEKAARGRKDTCRYPWGQDADPNKMNFLDTGIGTRSTVGCFTYGRSEYGAEEMSGNVYEWCRDWYKSDLYENRKRDVKDPEGPNSGEYRVLRGGSFYYNLRLVRCAYRNNDDPFNRSRNVGFRVLLLPNSDR